MVTMNPQIHKIRVAENVFSTNQLGLPGGGGGLGGGGFCYCLNMDWYHFVQELTCQLIIIHVHVLFNMDFLYKSLLRGRPTT